MDSRKIQVVGARSYAVSLPKQWITDNKLKNHDSVFIEIGQNKELIINKLESKKKDFKKIHADIDSTDTLIEFIVFCYMKNVDSLVLHYEKKDYKILGLINHALKYLEGYEITHEEPGKTEISFLFQEVNVTLPKILTRMFYLLKLHLEAINAKDDKTLEEGEMSIDRLYHLSRRVLFSCIQNHSKRIENEIKNDEELIYLQTIVKRVESISDNLYKLKGENVSKQEMSSLNEFVEIIGLLLGKKTKPSSLKHKINEIDVHSKNHEVETVLHRVHDLVKDIFEARISMEFDDKLGKDISV